MRRHISQVMFVLLAISMCGSLAFAKDKGENNSKGKLIELARESYRSQYASFQAGRVLPESLYQWSRRWMEAEMAALDRKSSKRIKAIREHVNRMTNLEATCRAVDAGVDSVHYCLPALGYYVVEASLFLQKEQQDQKSN